MPTTEPLLGRLVALAAEPRVYVARRGLAVPDRHRDRALGGHDVATGEDAGMAGHQIGADLDHAVLDADVVDALEQPEVRLLAERQHERVGRKLLDLTGRLREPGLVELPVVVCDEPDGDAVVQAHAQQERGLQGRESAAEDDDVRPGAHGVSLRRVPMCSAPRSVRGRDRGCGHLAAGRMCARQDAEAGDLRGEHDENLGFVAGRHPGEAAISPRTARQARSVRTTARSRRGRRWRPPDTARGAVPPPSTAATTSGRRPVPLHGSPRQRRRPASAVRADRARGR
jgi:hypothetical protein